ncbi:unannotated protein [freshwater metagenome]|uniref:Unannotated protein n=1 Tax=freshwater metagenome TaxID=449393 RepID=A0A6J7HTJ8_9ZZZZ|nr:hypothetical protein [Actinomycetota bacterium]
MFNFRYHAISLVAVLVALAVGLLLGVAIGDAGLVSSAENSLRDSLRGDVKAARADAAQARTALEEEQRYAQAAYPLLVSGRLTNQQVGLLFLGSPSESIASEVRAALEGSGARLAGVLALREPPDRAALAAAAGTSRYATLADDPALLEPFGKRIGMQLMQGGSLLEREAQALFSTSNGGLGPFTSMVVYRADRDLKSDAARETAALENGLMTGLTRMPASIIGVQETTTDPSQVRWYRSHGLASVDNMDQIAGHAALVFTLAGAEGSYGVGGDAGALLPGPESIAR